MARHSVSGSRRDSCGGGVDSQTVFFSRYETSPCSFLHASMPSPERVRGHQILLDSNISLFWPHFLCCCRKFYSSVGVISPALRIQQHGNFLLKCLWPISV